MSAGKRPCMAAIDGWGLAVPKRPVPNTLGARLVEIGNNRCEWNGTTWIGRGLLRCQIFRASCHRNRAGRHTRRVS